MKSIVTETMDRCLVCHTNQNLHIHHVFGGTANRKNSEKYGLKVCLCAYHHNGSKYGVHFNKELDLKLKKMAQTKFEEIYGHDEFMRVFRRNYL